MAKYIIRNINNKFDMDVFPTFVSVEQQILNNEYVGIELLIMKTKDDELIVIYSNKLEDALGNALDISNLTLNEIKTHIPEVIVLRRLLEELKTNKIILITPICSKDCEKTYEILTNMIESYPDSNVYVQVFNVDELDYIDFLNPKHKKGLYVDSIPDIKVLEKNANFFNINYDLIDKDTVASLISNNYDVFTALNNDNPINSEIKLKNTMQELYNYIFIIKSI